VNVLNATNDLQSTEAGWTDWFWRSPARFLCLVIAFLVAAFPKVLLGWHTFFYRDYGVLAYPFVFYQRECFWRGELPLWNPLSNCGAPFLAQWGTMNLYPFSLLYLVFPLPWSLGLFCFTHLAWGAVGVYLLAHHWVQERYASAVAGLVYVFNGVTFSCLLWPNYTVALGWMPWVILLVERSWREGGRWLGLSALACALQLLSGVPEIVLFTWLVTGLFWVRDLWGTGVGRWRLAGRLCVVLFLAAGLAAAQLLPFFDLLAHSQRNPGFATTKWAMPTWGWANLLVPMFHCFQTPQGTFFQFGQEFLSSYYLGSLILVLAGWAVWKVRQGAVWVLAGLVGFSLVFALGDQGFIYSWCRKLFPVLGMARYPVKFMILAALTVPMLAAFALAFLEKQRSRDGKCSRSIFVLGAVAALLTIVIVGAAKLQPFPYDQWDVTLRNTVWRLVFLGAGLALLCLLGRNFGAPARLALRLALLGVLVVDILIHSPNQMPTLPSAVMAPGLWAQEHKVAAPMPGHSRVWITPQAERKLLRSTVEDHLRDFLGKRLALWSNLNLLEGIAKVNGSSTLQLREQKQVQDLIYQETNSVPAGLIDFLAVSYQTAAGSAVEWTNRPSGQPWICGGQKPIYAEAEETLRQLTTPEFDPRAVVLLPGSARAETEGIEPCSCRIELEAFSPHRISFQVEADRPSVVVVAQSYYHAWRVFVDDTPSTLWRANYAFQALVVPKGVHRVQLRYQDLSFQLGLVLTAASLVICGFLWFKRSRVGSQAR
jgi:hypothetical protein